MDIAAMSMAISQNQVMQQASLSVTKKAMDVAEVQMQSIVDMMQSSSPAASFGQRMDIRA